MLLSALWFIDDAILLFCSILQASQLLPEVFALWATWACRLTFPSLACLDFGSLRTFLPVYVVLRPGSVSVCLGLGTADKTC